MPSKFLSQQLAYLIMSNKGGSLSETQTKHWQLFVFIAALFIVSFYTHGCWLYNIVTDEMPMIYYIKITINVLTYN